MEAIKTVGLTKKFKDPVAVDRLDLSIEHGELWDTIRALKGRITVILTTHYMEEAEMLSDRIAND